MARCQRNDVGSLLLNRAATATTASGGGGGGYGVWDSFSGSAFRRKILDAMRCGGASLHRRNRRGGGSVVEEDDGGVVVAGAVRSVRTKAARGGGRSEKLSDLLNLSESPDAEDAEAERRRKVEALDELKGVVRRFQSPEAAEQREGALRVRRLAKEDGEARTTLAMLGAIPPLVGLLDSEDQEILVESLYALLNLGIGNDVNKAAIVKAGAVHKMLMLIESPKGSLDAAIAEAIVGNFLSLSALDSNKPIIGSSGAIAFLFRILKNLDSCSSQQAKQDALRALYNLSIWHSNVSHFLEVDLIPFLLNSLGDMEVSERILMILSNLVSTPEGRKGVSNVKDAFPILVDVLNWNDSPDCQEKVSYILMVMAHKGYGDRQAMIEAGIVSALLELTLLGSTLAQKRASRILECLAVDKGKQVSESYGGIVGTNVSAPICGSSSSAMNGHQNSKEGWEDDENMMSEEKKAVKQLVRQSLQNNMKRIVKRANLPQDFVPSEHFKSLTVSSTSKSLPF